MIGLAVAEMRAEDSTSDQEVRRLADIKITPSNHVDMCLHVAAFMLIDQVRMLDPDGDLGTVIDRFPFAAQYLDGVLPFLPSGLTWEDARAFWDTAIEEWERDHCSALPICRLRAALGIGRGVITAMLLSALAEDDSRFGHMWAYLNGGVARRPTFETLRSDYGSSGQCGPSERAAAGRRARLAHSAGRHGPTIGMDPRDFSGGMGRGTRPLAGDHPSRTRIVASFIR